MGSRFIRCNNSKKKKTSDTSLKFDKEITRAVLSTKTGKKQSFSVSMEMNFSAISSLSVKIGFFFSFEELQISDEIMKVIERGRSTLLVVLSEETHIILFYSCLKLEKYIW